MSIPVIDLFAGPGGLGEGFSSLTGKKGNRKFKIHLSIEKDLWAHKTLELRSFFRQFPVGEVPKGYYELLKNADYENFDYLKAELFGAYPTEGKKAQKEAWNATLGEISKKKVDKRIRKKIGDAKKWVLIGGPPCQAYSLAGRSRTGGVSSDDHRVYLYKQYLRIIAVHHPPVFVMENVKGLLSAKLKGKSIFQMILDDLKSPSKVFPGNECPNYRIFSLVKKPAEFSIGGDPLYQKTEDFLIESEKYGIPQRRHRVILLGIRNDLPIENLSILKEEEEIQLKKVIRDLPKLRSGLSRKIVGEEKINGKRKVTYELVADNSKNWVEIVSSHRECIISKNGFGKLSESYKIETIPNGKGAGFLPRKAFNNEKIKLAKWYYDEKLKGVCNHEARSHMIEDLKRYFYAALYARSHDRSPRLSDFPEELLPSHKNARSGNFNDRFRVQRANEPATTVTSHLAKDGHYFIHYDPTQCRSLTVREAARIQTFPDNYYFCGPRTAQYTQVGNAVPPLLAKKIAEIVLEIFNSPEKKWC